MVFEHSQYRSFLKACLADRISSNRAYSLRAFARQLELAPSMLSEVLRGKKNLSTSAALKVARKLGLEAREVEYFMQLVQLESTDDPDLKAALAGRIYDVAGQRKVHDFSVDLFKTISDWYHLPILELSRLDGFRLDADRAAGALGISRLEAEVAIERLERLELLKRDRKGRLVKERDLWMISAKVPNESLRRYHRQMLEKAIQSLESQTPSEKFVGSETFGIDPGQLGEAGEIIERFLGEMTQLSKRARKRTAVYHLGTQFFRLSSLATSAPTSTPERGEKK